jgi:WD40 repeat protein
MPPPDNKVGAVPLTPQELGLIQQWIAEGAVADAGPASGPIAWQPLPPGVNPIYAVAVSPDGQLAACSRANQIFIYHVASGTLLTRLTDPMLLASQVYQQPGVAHFDLVQALAFSPDGQTLASSAFREVKFWQRPRDVKKLDLAGLSAPAQCAELTADGRWAALGLADGNIALWDLVEGRAVRSLAGHAAAVTALRLIPGTERLVSASADKTLRIWNLADGTALGRIETPHPLAALALLDDGQRVATGGGDGLIRLWNLGSLPTRQLVEPPPAVTVMSATPDGKRLVVAGPQGTLTLYDGQSLEQVQTLPGREVPVLAVSLSADGARLAAAEGDGLVRVWDVAQAQVHSTIRPGALGTSAVALHPAGNQVAVAAGDQGQTSVYKLDVPAPAALPAQLESGTTAAAVSPDGKLLALGGSAAGKPAIVLVDLAAGNVVRTLAGHEGPIAALGFAADGGRLISGSGDRTARVWNVADGQLVSTFSGHTQGVTAVALGTQAFSAAADGSLKAWNPADGKEEKNFAGHTGAVTGLAVTSNGQQLHSISADKSLRAWNPADGAQIRLTGLPAAGVQLALARDDSRLAAATEDGAVRVLQTADAKELWTAAGHEAAPRALVFSADGQRLASASAQRAVVWDAAQGVALEAFAGAAPVQFARLTAVPGELLLICEDKSLVRHTLRFERALSGAAQRVVKLAYRPDGNTLYAAAADGSLRGFQGANPQPAFTANHGAGVVDLAVSADGKWLATAGADKLVRVWSAENGSGAPKPQLGPLAGPVGRVAFTPDSQRVVGSTAAAPEVQVFHLASGLVEQTFAEHAAGVNVLAIVGSAQSLAISASADGPPRVWPLAGGGQLAGHTQPATALAAVPGQPKLLVSSGPDQSIRKWNLENGQQVQQWDQGAPVLALAVRPDGKQLAAAGGNNQIRLWNLENGQPWQFGGNQNLPMVGGLREQLLAAQLERAVGRATNRVADLKKAVTEAEARVKTTGEESTKAVAAKEAAAKTLVDKTAAAKAPVEAKAAADQELETAQAALKSATEQAAAAKAAAEKDAQNADLAKAHEAARKTLEEADRKVKEAEQKSKNLAEPASKATQEMITAEAALMAAEQGILSAQRVQQKANEALPLAQAAVTAGEAALTQRQGELEAAKKASAGMEQPVRALAYSPDGGVLVSGGENRSVRVWKSESALPLEAYAGHQAPVQALAVSSQGHVLSTAADKTATLWDGTAPWQLVRTVGGAEQADAFVDRVLALAFSPDGKLLAAGGGEPSRTGELKILNTADGSVVRTIPDAHSDTLFGLDFSPDGALLASCGADRFVKVFRVADGQLERSFEGHTHHVLDVAWRGDGRILASAGADNVIKVWDFISGEQKLTTQPLSKEVTALSFVGDGPRTLASSGDQFVRLYNTENGGNERNFGEPRDFLYCVAGTPDGRLVVAGGQESKLFVWNLENGQLLLTLPPPQPPPPAGQAQAP